MLNFVNSFFVGLFLDVFCNRWRGVSVRWGMGVEYSHVKEGTLKTSSPLAATSSLAPSSVMAEVPERAWLSDWL